MTTNRTESLTPDQMAHRAARIAAAFRAAGRREDAARMTRTAARYRRMTRPNP